MISRGPRTRASGVAILTLGPAIGFVFGGCTSPSAPVPSQSGPTMSDMTPPAIATHGGTVGIGEGALLEGEIEVADGCLVLRTSGGLVVPIFPLQLATWDNGLRLDGDVASIGDDVRVGGGFAAPSSSAELSVPAECSGVSQTEDGFFVVVSAERVA